MTPPSFHLPSRTNDCWQPTQEAAELFTSEALLFHPEFAHSTPRNCFRAIKRPEDDSRAVVIIPGFNEPCIKYVELAYQLYVEGFSVYLFDHLGQGLSEREKDLPVDLAQNAYLQSFEETFVDRLINFVHQVVRPNHSEIFAIAHSMGGLVSAHALGKDPTLFGRIVFSAPAFKVYWGDKPPGVPPVTSYLLGVIGCALGFGHHRAPLPGGTLSWWDPFSPITGVLLTHNDRLLRWYERLRASNPTVAMKGVSMRWLKELVVAEWGLPDASKAISAPCLVLTAETDTLVKEEGHKVFCRNAPNSSRIFVKGSYHELLFEADPVGEQVTSAAIGFLKTASVDAGTLCPNNGDSSLVLCDAESNQPTPKSLQTLAWLTCACVVCGCGFVWSLQNPGMAKRRLF